MIQRTPCGHRGQCQTDMDAIECIGDGPGDGLGEGRTVLQHPSHTPSPGPSALLQQLNRPDRSSKEHSGKQTQLFGAFCHTA